MFPDVKTQNEFSTGRQTRLNNVSEPSQAVKIAIKKELEARKKFDSAQRMNQLDSSITQTL